jgi:hypothetical protein
MPDRPWRTEFVEFPPRWRTVLLPAPPSRAVAQGISLYTAVRPLPVIAQHAVWLAARMTSGRAVRGARRRWEGTPDDEVLDELWAQLRRIARRDADGVAIYQRLQAERSALTFVYCAGEASLFVRVRDTDTELGVEQRVAAAASSAAFAVPRVLDTGTVGGWYWSAHEMIAPRPHRPVLRPPRGLFADITAAVEDAIPRPAGVPAHWRGCHGDVTPWNLRRGRSRIWLIDWEDAGYAPPHSDEVYFDAVRTAVGGRRPAAVGRQHPEAREYWLDVIGRRPVSAVEDRLARRLRAALTG